MTEQEKIAKRMHEIEKEMENWKMTIFVKTADGKIDAEYKAYGYRIRVYTVDYLDSGWAISVKRPRENRYALDVDVNPLYPEEGAKIQTTAMGWLNTEEIEKVIEAYKTAQTLGKEIEAAFPQCFKAE